ncbi:MAG: hypothetical protein A3C66_00835 [Candidatus Magasanikbacteria bacterium RIFCSPHIGHO2_02_FULL_41_35]|nr:MAG: hypothetical protein A3C66_00835 [Candidatus Magasanikbacteria bacterium RIFCSPHIGHO2_02_FULL_41_35]
MRVLLVNKFWYHRGGAEQVVFVTKQLLEGAGHTVAIFGMHDSRNEITEPYLADFVDTAKPSWRDVWRILYNREAKNKFSELIKKFKPDIIHFHNIYHQLSFSLIDAGRELGIPMVMTLHDYHWLSPNYKLFHHGQIDQKLIGKKFFRPLFTNCLEDWQKTVVGMIDFIFRSQKKYRNAIDQFICPSEFIKQLHVRAGWNESQLAVVGNPINQFNQLPDTDNFVDGLYVAYVGRLAKEKGIETFIFAAKITPEIPYKIFGTGPDESRLRALVENNGVANVSFAGFKIGVELKQAINNARIVVVPSVWYENAPYSILEPMALGKIVIGSNIGGIPELLPKEFLVEPGNPEALAIVIKMWFNKSLEERNRWGNVLRTEALARHDSHLYLKKIEDLYEKLLINAG